MKRTAAGIFQSDIILHSSFRSKIPIILKFLKIKDFVKYELYGSLPWLNIDP